MGQIVERAKIIMSENMHKGINVEVLASKLGISYSRFRKVFKDYTGYAPGQYFQELKLRKSKELLVETNRSLKEIAYELNFNSYEYFIFFFKKRVGITPLEYRNLGKL
jgi:AraC-like DNA-binding protein